MVLTSAVDPHQMVRTRGIRCSRPNASRAQRLPPAPPGSDEGCLRSQPTGSSVHADDGAGSQPESWGDGAAPPGADLNRPRRPVGCGSSGNPPSSVRSSRRAAAPRPPAASIATAEAPASASRPASSSDSSNLANSIRVAPIGRSLAGRLLICFTSASFIVAVLDRSPASGLLRQRRGQGRAWPSPE